MHERAELETLVTALDASPRSLRRDSCGDWTTRTALKENSQIEFDLAAGKSIRQLANKYAVHEQASYRHKKNLPPQLKRAYLGPETDLAR